MTASFCTKKSYSGYTNRYAPHPKPSHGCSSIIAIVLSHNAQRKATDESAELNMLWIERSRAINDSCTAVHRIITVTALVSKTRQSQRFHTAAITSDIIPSANHAPRE